MYTRIKIIMLLIYLVGASLRPHSPATDDEVTNPAYNTITITDDHSKKPVEEPICCYAEVIIPTQSS